MLADKLRARGYDVVQTAEPGGTQIGRQIRATLLDSANVALSARAELLLYFASRAQNTEEVIRPALERGAVVLCDRFTDSTRAYQGGGRGLDRETIETLDRIATAGLRPDCTVVIDIPLEASLDRARRRNARLHSQETRLDDESLAFHQRVREAYRALVAQEPDRMRLVDGDAPIGEVHARVLETLKDHV